MKYKLIYFLVGFCIVQNVFSQNSTDPFLKALLRIESEYIHVGDTIKRTGYGIIFNIDKANKAMYAMTSRYLINKNNPKFKAELGAQQGEYHSESVVQVLDLEDENIVILKLKHVGGIDCLQLDTTCFNNAVDVFNLPEAIYYKTYSEPWASGKSRDIEKWRTEKRPVKYNSHDKMITLTYMELESTFGSPVISEKGLIGMVIDVTRNGQEVDALKIENLMQIVENWNYNFTR